MHLHFRDSRSAVFRSVVGTRFPAQVCSTMPDVNHSIIYLCIFGIGFMRPKERKGAGWEIGALRRSIDFMTTKDDRIPCFCLWSPFPHVAYCSSFFPGCVELSGLDEDRLADATA